MPSCRPLAAALVALMGFSGCTKTPPKDPVITAMAVPLPPEHLLVQVTIPDRIEEVPPTPETASTAPAPPKKPPSRPTQQTPTTPAIEPAPQTAVLQPRTDEQVSAISTKLDETDKKLDGLNRTVLSESEKAQFAQAKAFIRRAKDALQIHNYLYAEELARKAAAVANQLGRG